MNADWTLSINDKLTYVINDKLKDKLELWSRKNQLNIILEKLSDDELKSLFLEIYHRNSINWSDPVLVPNLIVLIPQEIIKRFFHKESRKGSKS